MFEKDGTTTLLPYPAYLERYLSSLNDVERAHTFETFRYFLIKYHGRDRHQEIEGWDDNHLLKEIEKLGPPVQLQTWVPGNVRMGDVVHAIPTPQALDAIFADLFAGFGWGYRSPSMTDEEWFAQKDRGLDRDTGQSAEEDPAIPSYARAVYAENVEAVHDILFTMARFLGRFEALIESTGSNADQTLSDRNLVSFVWPKDWDDTHIPDRDSIPTSASMRWTVDNVQNLMEKFVRLCSGNDIPSLVLQEALDVRRTAFLETFFRVQKNIIRNEELNKNPLTRVFQPEYGVLSRMVQEDGMFLGLFEFMHDMRPQLYNAIIAVIEGHASEPQRAAALAAQPWLHDHVALGSQA